MFYISISENGLPVLLSLPLPPVPGNVPMGTGSALTHLGLGRSMGLFYLVVDLLGKPQLPGVPPFYVFKLMDFILLLPVFFLILIR